MFSRLPRFWLEHLAFFSNLQHTPVHGHIVSLQCSRTRGIANFIKYADCGKNKPRSSCVFHPRKKNKNCLVGGRFMSMLVFLKITLSQFKKFWTSSQKYDIHSQ